MKENRITATNSKGQKESHVVFESENIFEATTITSLEFISTLTNYLHCLDFSIQKSLNKNVVLEINKQTYDEEIDYINKLVAYLIEKQTQNKPKIDFMEL